MNRTEQTAWEVKQKIMIKDKSNNTSYTQLEISSDIARYPGQPKNVIYPYVGEIKINIIIKQDKIIVKAHGSWREIYKKMTNELEKHQLKPLTCGNCEYYKVSGMLDDWGQGKVGYCFQSVKLEPKSDEGARMVDIFDYCERFRETHEERTKYQ